MIIALVVVIASVVLHEVAHAWIAYELGDRTAKRHGRLTLNPLAHIDPVWSLGVPLLSFMLFGIVIGAAKPMPIDYGPMTKEQRLSVASAGIMANLFLMVMGWGAGWTILWQVNAVLIAFNLLPVPPLDGWRIWRAIR